MYYFLLVLYWCFIIFLSRSVNKNGRVLEPNFVFLIMQIVSIILLAVLEVFQLIIPSYSINFISFLAILFYSTSFFVGTVIARGVIKPPIHSDYELGFNRIYTGFFYFTFFVACIGTIGLLSGMGINNIEQVYIMYTSDFSNAEQGFFNSSFAILWQASFACLFWSNFTKENKFNTLIVLLCILFIFFRGAFLYLILAFFYYITPRLVNRELNKKLLFIMFLFFLAMNLVVALSYGFENNILITYFSKTYPYLSGNFVNLFFHIDNALTLGFEKVNTIDDFLSLNGFSSILAYINKYSNSSFSLTVYFPFIEQSSNLQIMGNTASLYGGLVYTPFLIGCFHLFILGFICSVTYIYASKRIIAVCVMCWFSAASFLSFASGGHFSTTRFMPAALYIIPLIFLIYLLNAIRRN